VHLHALTIFNIYNGFAAEGLILYKPEQVLLALYLVENIYSARHIL